MRINRTWRHRIDSSRHGARRWVVYAAVALGALAGAHLLWSWLFAVPDTVAAQTRSTVNRAAVVSSFAQDFVTVWLTATDPHVLDAFATPPDAMVTPPTPAVVLGAPNVVAVELVGNAGKNAAAEQWSVVVGVTQRPWESAPPTRALYRVSILWSRFGPRATGMPARVSGPGAGADLPVAYPVTLGQGDPLWTLVSGWAAAYLTGSTPVSLYITTDSLISGLGGAYQSATLTGLRADTNPAAKPAEGQRIRVYAQVDALTAQYAHTYMSYPLTLRGVGGAWRIAAIDRAPAMIADDDPQPVTQGDNNHG